MLAPEFSLKVVISGIGMHHPPESISNAELANMFNQYVEDYNLAHDLQINEGKIIPLKKSCAAFIEKVSGVKSRYVRDKANILNPDVMWPHLAERLDSELSLQAEVAVQAAKEAMRNSNKDASDIDLVIMSCAHTQRDFPSVAIEVQNELGINGYAYHMGSACSSASFGIQAATNAVISGMAKGVLLVCPEIKSGQFSYKDRGSNFIFGEATVALIIEKSELCTSTHAYAIQDLKLITKYSNNIRNNRGAYNQCDPQNITARDKFFYQNGCIVFKEVSLLVIKTIKEHLCENRMSTENVARFWLHQANSNMIHVIAKRILGERYQATKVPIVLDRFGNTSSAGAILSMYFNHKDLTSGDVGMLCTFGAGYSVGCIILQKI